MYSSTYNDHLTHLQLVLSRLKDKELYVEKSKCEVLTTQTKFLGLQLGVNSISVGEDRKKIVREWPKPETLTDLRGLIGLLQSFRRFIEGFSKNAAPPTNLIQKGSGIHKCDTKCTVAFELLKDKLCIAPIVQAPD